MKNMPFRLWLSKTTEGIVDALSLNDIFSHDL